MRYENGYIVVRQKRTKADRERTRRAEAWYRKIMAEKWRRALQDDG